MCEQELQTVTDITSYIFHLTLHTSDEYLLYNGPEEKTLHHEDKFSQSTPSTYEISLDCLQVLTNTNRFLDFELVCGLEVDCGPSTLPVNVRTVLAVDSTCSVRAENGRSGNGRISAAMAALMPAVDT